MRPRFRDWLRRLFPPGHVVAVQSFAVEGIGIVCRGDRVRADHEIVTRFPGAFVRLW